MRVLAEIIETLYPDLPSHTPEPDVVTFLNESRIPLEIVEDLCCKTSVEYLVIGNLDLFPINELKITNLDDVYFPWYNDGYVTIAQGANGDPVVFDIKTNLIAFVHHDEMDYDDPSLIPSKHVIHTPLDYEQFWRQCAADDDFPLDAYAAEEIWGRPERGIAA